jgi:hypothetical protein
MRHVQRKHGLHRFCTIEIEASFKKLYPLSTAA